MIIGKGIVSVLLCNVCVRCIITQKRVENFIDDEKLGILTYVYILVLEDS